MLVCHVSICLVHLEQPAYGKVLCNSLPRHLSHAVHPTSHQPQVTLMGVSGEGKPRNPIKPATLSTHSCQSVKACSWSFLCSIWCSYWITSRRVLMLSSLNDILHQVRLLPSFSKSVFLLFYIGCRGTYCCWCANRLWRMARTFWNQIWYSMWYIYITEYFWARLCWFADLDTWQAKG